MSSGDHITAAAEPQPDDPPVFAVVDGMEPPLWGTRGCYFTPTDADMIGFLADKLRGFPVPRLSIDLNATIHNAQVYGIPPEQLLSQYAPVNGLWYFFTKRIPKYPNGSRPCRSVGQKGTGFWKATGAEKSIRNDQGSVMGKKQSLVFYWGEQNGGKDKSDWIMHEYTLNPSIVIVAPSKKPPNPFVLPVLCKIYKKTQGMNQQAEENHYDGFSGQAEETPEIVESEEVAAPPIKKRQRSGHDKKSDSTGASTSTSVKNEETKTEQQSLQTSDHIDLAYQEHAFAANYNYDGDLPQQQPIAQNSGYVDDIVQHVDSGNYNHHVDIYDQQLTTQFNTYDHTTEHVVDWNYNYQMMNVGDVGAPPNQLPSYEHKQQELHLGAPGNVIACPNYLLQQYQEVSLATSSTSGHQTAQMQTTNATTFAFPKMPLLIEPEEQWSSNTGIINNNTINMDQSKFSEQYINIPPGARRRQESNINSNMTFRVNHQNPAPVIDPTYPYAGGDNDQHDQEISTAPVEPPFPPDTIKAGVDGGLETVLETPNIAGSEAGWPYDCDDDINRYLQDFEYMDPCLKDVKQEDHLNALDNAKSD